MTSPVDTRQVIERVNQILTTFKRIDPQVRDVLHQATAMAAELVIARAKLGRRLQPASSPTTELETKAAAAAPLVQVDAKPIHTPGFRKVDFAGEYLEQTSGRPSPADLVARRAAQPLAYAIPAATPHDPTGDAKAEHRRQIERDKKQRWRAKVAAEKAAQVAVVPSRSETQDTDRAEGENR